MVRKLCSIFCYKNKTKIDTSRPTVGKFRSKLNYAAEAMLIFLNKKQNKNLNSVLWPSLAVN